MYNVTIILLYYITVVRATDILFYVFRRWFSFHARCVAFETGRRSYIIIIIFLEQIKRIYNNGLHTSLKVQNIHTRAINDRYRFIYISFYILSFLFRVSEKKKNHNLLTAASISTIFLKNFFRFTNGVAVNIENPNIIRINYNLGIHLIIYCNKLRLIYIFRKRVGSDIVCFFEFYFFLRQTRIDWS